MLGENRATEAEPLHDARPEIFDEDVGIPDQTKQYILALLASNIESDALFVPIVGEEVRGMILAAKRAERVASIRMLDLYDLGSEISHQHARQRTGDHRRGFDDLDAFKG